uniref:Piwi domain-containing protein n=1 Tax=Caenorhabditis tropicalis TaxID=1561998 RepID=A0A1I7TQZ5_9PELO
MEDQWLLSAIYDDGLVEKIRERRTNSSRNTSINEYLNFSPSSRCFDEFLFPVIKEPKAQFQLAAKPRESHIGRLIPLLSNQFQISCSGSLVYQYKIQITPFIPSKKLNRKIVSSLKEQIGELEEFNLVFDGIDTIYTTKPIDIGKMNNVVINVKGVVNTKESPNRFSISFRFVDSFLLDTKITDSQEPGKKLQMMHAIDTIFRQTSSGAFHVVLQSFFSITPHLQHGHGLGWGTVNLGLGREVCYGFYQNVTETFNGLTMNLDVATTTFYRPIALVEFLAEILEVPLATVTDGRCLSDAQKKKFNREITGLKVETRHCGSPRRFRVARCTWKPMDCMRITINDSQKQQVQISMIDYFKNRYNIDLKQRHLPCVEVGRSRECVLPLELCFLVSGQRCIKKLNEQQIANLIRATSRNANERKTAVLNLHDRIKINDDPHAARFGLRVENELMQLHGRVLPAPRLLYCHPNSKRQNCVTTPTNGTWDMRGKNFYLGVEIRKWAVACFAEPSTISSEQIHAFVLNLRKVAREIGMPFVDNFCFCRYTNSDQTTSVLDYLNAEYPDLQLVLCIVPGKSTVYGDLKRRGDLLGVNTQCVRTHNVAKNSPHTLSNLCMKINSKLGGTNVVISAPPSSVARDPVLFVGCHLSRNPTGIPDGASSSSHSDTSIACLVGSMDGYPTRFAPVFRVQPRQANTIVDLGDMIREAILNFWNSTGFKPHKIVIYRAGIQDVEEILQVELRALREACSSIDPAYQPGFTFIGLDVTHHTRLFAADDADQIGASRNVPAGTLVETGVTVNNLFEFFLVSHAGIQGTSRPTRYIVMWDDNQMPPEEIHEMTYQLCHTQSRCTRSVSIPSPVYYAKLVAQRAKILMADENFDIDRFRKRALSDGMLFT